MTEQRRGLDGDWYTDPGTFAEELDRIFTRTWQLVGHAGQLRNAGDYLTATIGDQGIVVNRLADGSLHAMYNVPSLADTVPGIEEEVLAVAPTAPGRTLTHRRTHLCHANWKIAVENYNECYHCPNVHKAFTRGVVSPESYRIASRGQAIRHSATAPATTGYALAGGGEPYESFFVFPVSSIQCYPGEVLNTFRWVPLAVDRTLLVREWWFDADEPTDEQREIIDLDWDTTVSEDFDLMDSVQRGMRSRGYTPGPLIESTDGVATVHSEDTVPHLHDLVRTALGR